MNPKMLRLAGDFLDRAADEFSTHGCNDWRWPGDWTAEERRAFAVLMHESNLGKPVTEFSDRELEELESDWNHKNGYGPADWCVMRFLARLLKEFP